MSNSETVNYHELPDNLKAFLANLMTNVTNANGKDLGDFSEGTKQFKEIDLRITLVSEGEEYPFSFEAFAEHYAKNVDYNAKIEAREMVREVLGSFLDMMDTLNYDVERYIHEKFAKAGIEIDWEQQ